jgi:BASS family bile acid:Na+ symporter
LELTLADFKRVAILPKGFLVGAISQMFCLPLVAFGLLSFWHIEPVLAVGVMIIAACPGGVTSNLMTYLARGDTALSVSLTAIISLLSVVSLPMIVSFSIFHFMEVSSAPELSIGRTILGVFAITTMPVIIGMATNRYLPTFAWNFERKARTVAATLFIVIIAGAIYAERENIVDFFKQAGLVTFSLNLVMMALAFSLSKVSRLGVQQRIAITLECGLQNGTLAIFVAVTLIGSREMMVPAAIYSLLMFPTAVAYLLFVVGRRRET